MNNTTTIHTAKGTVKRKSATTIHDTVIVGAGFAGLGTAIKLLEAGVKNFIILERSSKPGGTWRDNQYPGAACDIPSNLYSFSFAPNPNWSRSFSGSKEIYGYIEYLVKKFGLSKYIQYDQNVQAAELDDLSGVWTIRTNNKKVFKGRAVVMASGPLANPKLPDIPGRDAFKGKVIHSARWDHDYDLAGKNVAVIGTGASAIQIIPELVKQVNKLTVFQRTPAWVMPRPDFTTSEFSKALFRKLPFTQKAIREMLYWTHESMALAVIWDSPMHKLAETLGKAFLYSQVKDSWMRRQLKPDYKIGCKRILVSNDYYPALQSKNCELITWPIAGISEFGVRSADGIEHQVDCIVYATGFDVPKTGTPFVVKGMGGRVLAEAWQRGAQAYKSVNVSGFPNLFITFGPNSGPGHNSALVYMEQQIAYIVKGVRNILDGNLKMLDVKPEVQARYNANIQKRLAKTNWNSGCKSWYLTDDGFNATMYPGFATQYARQMARFDLRAYQQVRR